MLISKYIIDKEHNLIFEFHSGDLDLEAFISYKTKLIQDINFSPNLNYFIHLKNSIFVNTTNEINEYVNFLEKNAKIFGKRRLALVTNTPNQVVNTTLFKILCKNTHNIVEIFSSNEKAINWLSNSYPKERMYQILEKFIEKE
jgi:hypothetical protein